MERLFLLTMALALSSLSAFTGTGCSYSSSNGGELILNGNIDDRQVNVSFLVSERIAEIMVEEGSVVKQGDLLGALETVRIQQRVDQAQAYVDAAQASYDKAINGARPEEIAIAQAQVDSAKAALEKAENGYRPEEVAMAAAAVDVIKAQIKAAENLYERNKSLSKDNITAEQDLDNAESNFKKLVAEQTVAEENFKRIKAGTRKEDIESARAALAQAEANLLQLKTGTRKEDIAAAKANLVQAQSALAIQRQALTDTKLTAPCDGIVRSRILEPGEMASPQSPALTIAVVSPKWVRVYLNETLLSKVKPGDKASIQIDGLPGLSFDGWLGYISPNAEFTPKNVETPELRTSLVYEVRVYVNDPENILKLGAPATVAF